MKRRIILLLAFAGLLFSCGNKSSQAEENNEVVVKAFLTTLYSDYVFQYHEFSLIENHFSEKVLKRLKQEYDYDGEGYAVWLFRTGAQDGPSNVSKVNDITTEPDGWYVVKYTDMGIEGTCRFLIQLRDGEPFVLDFK